MYIHTHVRARMNASSLSRWEFRIPERHAHSVYHFSQEWLAQTDQSETFHCISIGTGLHLTTLPVMIFLIVFFRYWNTLSVNTSPSVKHGLIRVQELPRLEKASEISRRFGEHTSAAAAVAAEDTKRCTSPDLYNRAALLCLRLLCRGTCLRITSQTLSKEGRGETWSKTTVF